MQDCNNLADLTAGKLVVENDQLVDVSVSKAWQDAEGKIISAPEGASVQFTLFYKEKDSSAAYATTEGTSITGTPTISLSGSNWTATWIGLSPDYDYQVKETGKFLNYTPVSDTASNGGTITNKRDSNSLTITKTVTKDPANLPVTIPADTTFTVYHAENDQKYTSFKYSDMTNGTKVLANVPTGEYYVDETGAVIPTTS